MEIYVPKGNVPYGRYFNHSAHKALWNWLAKHPDCVKSLWPGWEHNGGKIRHHRHWCLACGITDVTRNSLNNCHIECGCPLTGWGQERCDHSGALFARWIFNNDSKLALQIRNLPISDGWEKWTGKYENIL